MARPARSPKSKKIKCDCCGRIVSERTVRRHRQEQAPPHVKATNLFKRQLISRVMPLVHRRKNRPVKPTKAPLFDSVRTVNNSDHEMGREVENFDHHNLSHEADGVREAT